MNQMVNNIQLIWKLACMLRTYRTYNLTVEFSKYQFNNKLLGGVTLLMRKKKVVNILTVFFFLFLIKVMSKFF